MKKIIVTLLLIASIGGYAQITLENTYPSGTGNFRLVKLSSSGYKYALYDASAITLYNLNHTVFRTVTLPSTVNMSAFYVYYLSEELFNTNPADIEYIFVFTNPGNSSACFRVFDEAGNTLFSRDSTTLISPALFNDYEDAIAYTPSGWKMTLVKHPYGLGASVYSLPGFLPCHDCTNGMITGMGTENSELKNGNITNYPNPNKGETTIEYSLPQGTTKADLVFYTLQGQEVKRYKITDAFHTIVISTADLDAGTYYYEIQTTAGYKAGKKMVVVK